MNVVTQCEKTNVVDVDLYIKAYTAKDSVFITASEIESR